MVLIIEYHNNLPHSEKSSQGVGREQKVHNTISNLKFNLVVEEASLKGNGRINYSISFNPFYYFDCISSFLNTEEVPSRDKISNNFL